MSNIRTYADQLSDVYVEIDDAKVKAKSIIEAAREAGINTKLLTKVARELVMESSKLRKKLAEEQELDQMRSQLDLFARKGVDSFDTPFRVAAE